MLSIPNAGKTLMAFHNKIDSTFLNIVSKIIRQNNNKHDRKKKRIEKTSNIMSVKI